MCVFVVGGEGGFACGWGLGKVLFLFVCFMFLLLFCRVFCPLVTGLDFAHHSPSYVFVHVLCTGSNTSSVARHTFFSEMVLLAQIMNSFPNSRPGTGYDPFFFPEHTSALQAKR